VHPQLQPVGPRCRRPASHCLWPQSVSLLVSLALCFGAPIKMADSLRRAGRATRRQRRTDKTTGQPDESRHLLVVVSLLGGFRVAAVAQQRGQVVVYLEESSFVPAFLFGPLAGTRLRSLSSERLCLRDCLRPRFGSRRMACNWTTSDKVPLLCFRTNICQIFTPLCR